jgi:hypothetical protein
VNDNGLFGTFFRLLRMGRLAILLFFGLPILACVGIGLFVQAAFGKGTFIAFTADAAATVLVDARSYDLGPNSHQRIELSQGQHHVTVTTAGKTLDARFTIDSGLDTKIVAASADTCFAAVDVGGVFYEGKKSTPSVAARMKPGIPMDGSGSYYFDVEDLPDKVGEHESVNLVLPLDCAKIGGSDEDVVAGTGVLAMRDLMDAMEAQPKTPASSAGTP